MNRIPKCWAVVLLSILAPLACDGKQATQEPEPVRPVRVEKVGSGATEQGKSFSGTIKAGTETKLSFQVAGALTGLSLKVGEKLKKGAVVASLGARDQSLQVEAARAGLGQVQAQLTNARAQYGRVKALYENGNATQADLDTARTAFEASQAGVKAAAKQVELYREQAGKTVLRSPVTGVVAQVLAESGENVNPGQPVVIVNSGDRAKVAFTVPEAVVSSLEVGAEVGVYVDALGGPKLTAVISEVGVTSGRTATTYPVTATFATANPKLRPGMVAAVEIAAATEAGSKMLRVNPKAVGEDRDGRFVFLALPTEAGFAKVQRRKVLVGELDGAGLQVKQGVKPGDWLVTAGLSHLTDGQRVRLPKEVTAGSAPSTTVPAEATSPSPSAAPTSPRAED